jgi:hypothetical protein
MDIALLRQEIEQDPTGIGYPADVGGRLAAINARRTNRWVYVPTLDDWLKSTPGEGGLPLWCRLWTVRQTAGHPLQSVAALIMDQLSIAKNAAGCSFAHPQTDEMGMWLSVESAATQAMLSVLVQAAVLTAEQRDEVVAMGQPRISRAELLWGEAVSVDDMRRV